MTPPVALLGVRYDARSSFLRGAAEGPTAVRRVLHSGMANWSTELGDSLRAGETFIDVGDLDPPDPATEAFDQIAGAVAEQLDAGRRVLTLGGDHSISLPVLRAHARHHEGLTILHFDAHPDLYDELDGDRFSHACPFARVMEEGLATRLIQIGIRTATPHQREQARRFRVETVEAGAWNGRVPQLDGPVYVTVDLDALDPACAPGVSHHEPGGLTVRELLAAVHQLRADGAEVVGADVVELNPSRDINDMTAAVAAKLTRELIGLLADDAATSA